ncbi:MAG: antibiotic biosynthesis monooxygenase [Magnetococcales bacterium]|nr:antibiotic biosynthesis monooxygenase [Magnetococcales bacterium]
MQVTMVHVTVKPEAIQEFIAACRDNHEASIREPGNLRFDVLQDPTLPTHFVLYEAYAGVAEALAHKETTHYQVWRDTVAPMMAEPRRGIPMNGLFPES